MTVEYTDMAVFTSHYKPCSTGVSELKSGADFTSFCRTLLPARRGPEWGLFQGILYSRRHDDDIVALMALVEEIND